MTLRELRAPEEAERLDAMLKELSLTEESIHLVRHLKKDGAPIDVDTRKAIALLAYLAVTEQRHSRDALAALLWPEYDQSRARGALRRTLSTLNKALGGAGLDAETAGAAGFGIS